MSDPFQPRGRRDAWFRVFALFSIVILLLAFSVLLLRGGGPLTFGVLIAGVAVAVIFNLWMIVRARTSQVTWMPGSEPALLRSALEYLGRRPAFLVNVWKAIAGAAVAVALVAIVVAR